MPDWGLRFPAEYLEIPSYSRLSFRNNSVSMESLLLPSGHVADPWLHL